MDLDLSELLAKTAVIERITKLFTATDERDWEAVEACFAPSVAFDMTSVTKGSATTVSPAEIIAGWKTSLANVEAIHHQTGNFEVKVRGARADASCYGTAYHYRRTPSGRNTRTFVGSYDFKLEMEGIVWRIAAFRFNLKFIEGNLNLD